MEVGIRTRSNESEEAVEKLRVVGQSGQMVQLAHLAGDDAHSEAFAMDQVTKVPQGGEVLVKPVQGISTAADGDKGLRTLPNEGKDRFI